jgi:hypothetical protein
VAIHQRPPAKVILEQTYKKTQTQFYKIFNSTFDSTEQINDIAMLFSVIQGSLFDNFGIEQLETSTATTDPNDEWNKNMDAFMLVVCLSSLPI